MASCQKECMPARKRTETFQGEMLEMHLLPTNCDLTLKLSQDFFSCHLKLKVENSSVRTDVSLQMLMLKETSKVRGAEILLYNFSFGGLNGIG